MLGPRHCQGIWLLDADAVVPGSSQHPAAAGNILPRRCPSGSSGNNKGVTGGSTVVAAIAAVAVILATAAQRRRRAAPAKDEEGAVDSGKASSF